MADLTIWISGADFIKLKSFFAPGGSIFLNVFWLKSAEIRDFSRLENVGMSEVLLDLFPSTGCP